MNYKEQWKKQGYLVVHDVFTPSQIADLYTASEFAFAQWKEDSTAENQPGAFFYNPAAWVLLNHPAYYKQHPEYLRTLLDAAANPLAMKIIQDIFQEQPMFMQENYYIDPPGETRIGNWHRDCQFYHRDDEEAEHRAVLQEADPPRELHMHIPLVPTAASELVPGSHDRWDSPEEHHIRRQDATSNEMPGAVSLNLEPGDLAFFQVNALHRGMYYQGVPRRTIAVTFSRESEIRMADAESMKAWNGYICTYQPWMLKPDYLDGVADSTRELFHRFISTYRDNWKSEYLSSLEPQLQAYFTDY